jgi:hypothetical protein
MQKWIGFICQNTLLDAQRMRHVYFFWRVFFVFLTTRLFVRFQWTRSLGGPSRGTVFSQPIRPFCFFARQFWRLSLAGNIPLANQMLSGYERLRRSLARTCLSTNQRFRKSDALCAITCHSIKRLCCIFCGHLYCLRNAYSLWSSSLSGEIEQLVH